MIVQKVLSKLEISKIKKIVEKKLVRKNHLKSMFTKSKDLVVTCIRELKNDKNSIDTSIILSKKDLALLKKSKTYSDFRDAVRKTFKIQEKLLCDNTAKDKNLIQNTAYDPTIDCIATAIDRIDLTTKVNRAKKDVKSDKQKKQLKKKVVVKK